MEATTTLDVRFNQDLHLGRSKVFIYLEVLNAGDVENVLWVDDVGLAGGILGDPGAIDLGRRFRAGIGLQR